MFWFEIPGQGGDGVWCTIGDETELVVMKNDRMIYKGFPDGNGPNGDGSAAVDGNDDGRAGGDPA